MAGLMQSIEIGRRALLTHQAALQTIGHNIANVNTPGYTRQRVNITSTFPEDSRFGTIGSGVTVADIRHIRDLFLGEQYRQESKNLGQWTYKEKIMIQIESVFSEPGENGLSDLLNRFWDAWGELSTNPNSVSNRVAVLEEAKLMTNAFQQLANQLNELSESIDKEIVNTTDEINTLTLSIARLNDNIKVQEAGGDNANDLRDRRDFLIDRLATIIDVNTIARDDGTTTVYIGAMTIVDGADILKLQTKQVNVDGTLKHELFWESTNIAVRNLNGRLASMYEARDKIIPKYRQRLDRLAGSMIDQVNQLHSAGYGLNGSTGFNFFNSVFTDAANISVNNELIIDPAKVVASASGEQGDNIVALDIQDLRNVKVLDNNTRSLNDFYNGIVGELGIETNTAISFTNNFELLVHQIENAKELVQGVSLDEEMTNLIRYQHAYDAAARVITAMDQALDTVINKMGIVGR